MLVGTVLQPAKQLAGAHFKSMAPGTYYAVADCFYLQHAKTQRENLSPRGHRPTDISEVFAARKIYNSPGTDRTGRSVLLEELSRELDRDETALHALELERIDEVDRQRLAARGRAVAAELPRQPKPS